jgi:thiol-disulfide isomerase/thioredoxin
MRSLTAIAAVALLALPASAQLKTRLEARVNGVGGGMVYLANYYGNRLFYADSARADAQGNLVFAKADGYAPGLYALMLPNGRVEVVLNEPLVRLSTEASDPNGRLQVLESRENTLYHTDRKAANWEQAKLRAIADQNPGTLTGIICRLDMEVEGEQVRRPDGALDSAATFRNMRAHAWDGIDLSDERLPYVPGFQNRLDDVVARFVPKDANAVVEFLNGMMERTKGSMAMRKFLVGWATTKYAEEETQGLGAVYVRMAERYVCTGPGIVRDPAWTPADRWDKVCAKTRAKASLVIGARSKDIILPDTTANKWVSMHAMPQETIILAFWGPHCSHCKQAIPLLYEQYRKEFKAMNVGVYAVAEATDESLFTDWKAFLREHKLDWVNVGLAWPMYKDLKGNRGKYVPSVTNAESLSYPTAWEVTGTPRFYVLDKERRIVARPQSLKELFEVVRAQKR